MIRKFLEKTKGILAVALMAVLLSQSLVPGFSRADEPRPRFNFLLGDLPLIQGANETRNDTDWSNPVTGSAGDEFAGLIYYHNGVVNSTATNVRIKVNLPTQTQNKGANITASISSDNTETITSTIVNGQIVGRPDLRIDLDRDTKITLVPNSVKWFPDSISLNNTPQPLPSGQTGNEIISGSGINIGNIRGCWEFAGFVSFRFRTEGITPTPTPANTTSSKMAKNLRTGEEGTDIMAKPGDTILYTLTVRNTGGTADKVSFDDDIADVLQLADVVEISDGGVLTGVTIDFPDFMLQANSLATRTFKVKIKDPLPLGDFVMTNVFGNLVSVRLPRPTKVELSLSKLVRNVSSNETVFVAENSANAGDTLEYKINFSNTGNTAADHVLLSDVIPANTQFIAGSTVISRNGGAESSLPDGIATTDNITLASIGAQENGYVKFRVLTSSTLADGEVLVNKAFLKFESQTLEASAKTVIRAKAVVTPSKQLPKTGAETFVLGFLASFSGYLVKIYRESKMLLVKKMR